MFSVNAKNVYFLVYSTTVLQISLNHVLVNHIYIYACNKSSVSVHYVLCYILLQTLTYLIENQSYTIKISKSKKNSHRNTI